MNIDMGYGISIWDTGYRYGIWANDMGDDSIDTVILHIDMGFLVTVPPRPSRQMVT
jgi:hypothetical protein